MAKIDYGSIDREYGYSGKLGAIYSGNKTIFRVWSPLADGVLLKLYSTPTASEPYLTRPMKRLGKVWQAEVRGDLHGIFYTYEFRRGKAAVESIDIYARSACANGTRGMVVDPKRTDPAGWEKSRPIKLENNADAVIYELHVRDFSMDPNADFVHRGKFAAFSERGVKNRFGGAAGLDHIASLGVTHIHLLPVFDFKTVDETEPNSGFNWGYDPQNYNIPEGSYCSDPNDGVARIREFKELVAAMHSRGMGVIMDVVYNHTFSAEDSPFAAAFPGYYYRHNDDGSLSNGSGCGNEFASERRMASKFICDSLCYLAEEYRMDGFRFDLMGLLDIKTLNRCAEKLREINPSIILYGEGWTGGDSPLPQSRRGVKRNARRLPRFAMFSDDFRDGVKGSVFCDEGTGYINGAAAYNTELMKSVISAGVFRTDVRRPKKYCWTNDPAQTVNYVEAHDNLTLHDKLRVSLGGVSEEYVARLDRMAAALVFLSQGVPFIQAGQEFLRSKPAADGGFVHDSYNSPDSINCLKWDGTSICSGMVEYYRGLISIRKRFPELRLRSAEEIRGSVIYEEVGGALAARISGRLILLINPTGEAVTYPVKRALVYADGERASAEPIYTADGNITAAPHSVVFAEEV